MLYNTFFTNQIIDIINEQRVYKLLLYYIYLTTRFKKVWIILRQVKLSLLLKKLPRSGSQLHHQLHV